MSDQCKSCGGFCGKSGCERLNTNHPDYDKTEWDVRGLLAESLKCWHRLTGEEAAELVAFVQAAQAVQPAPRRLTEAEITLLVEAYYEDVGIAPPDLIRQVEGLIFGATQPAHAHAIDTSPERVEKQAGNVQVPVLYQYRWTNPAGENQPASMLEWKPVEPAWNQTVEQKCNELRGYRYKGVPTYEVRGLYAAPSTKEGTI